MASTNGEMIIDGDGHIFEDTQAIANFLPSYFPDFKPAPHRSGGTMFPPLDHLHYAHLGKPRRGGGFEPTGLERWQWFLGEAGISTTVLYPTSALAYGKIVDRDWAIHVCRAYNDWLHDAYMSKDPRFKGMALIPMQEPEAAVEELRRAVQELGMPGAMLPSTGLKANLGSKEYWPIYQEADRLGCALGIHGGCHSGLGFDDLNVLAPTHALGHPFGITIAFAGMLFNGVFDKFPNAKIGFLEGGVAWFLLAMERFSRAYEVTPPYDPRGELIQVRDGETVADYMVRQVKAGRLFVGVEGEEATLPTAVKLVGNEAFLFSSDFPHEVSLDNIREEIGELLENEDLTPEDKEAILHTNAERFYNLTPAS